MLADQNPIGSGFGPATTATEVLDGIDLTGKVAVVTGGYSGIGTETTRALAAAGATVIVPARSLKKAAQTVGGIPGVRIEEMDLTDPASIDAFAQRVIAEFPAIHILVNSAGIMASPLTRDTRGYEAQFATNHLGHFQLAVRLWPALAAAGGARIVAVSSMGHNFAPVDLEDPHFETTEYDPWVAYGRAKTANVLFAVEADRLGAPHGIRAFALHPGRILTDIARFMTPEAIIESGIADAEGRALVDPENGLKSPAQGAATSVWGATSRMLDGRGGLYLQDVDVAPVIHGEGDLFTPGVNAWAIDPDVARRLWALSARLTGADLTEPEDTR